MKAQSITLMGPPTRKMFALRHKTDGGYLGTYPSKDSAPYMLLFPMKDMAEDARRRLEWLADSKKITHSNARVFAKGIAVHEKKQQGSSSKQAPPQKAVGKDGAVRFVVGRPPPDEVFWIGESENARESNRSLALASISEEEMLSLTSKRNVGVTIVDKLVWSDARSMTFSCCIMDPTKMSSREIASRMLEMLMELN